MQVNV